MLLERDRLHVIDRQNNIFLSAAESHPAPLTFEHTFEIYLKDSNAAGNTYFSRYFEWQGVCRERWFRECIVGDLPEFAGMILTRRAYQEYVHETFPFQSVVCRLNTFAVNLCSCYLLFTFMVSGRVVSTGYQQIVYADQTRRVRRAPVEISERVKQYELTRCTAVN